MSFIEEFNEKYEERNNFIKVKEQEVLDNTNKFEAAKEEVEKAKKEYFISISNETLTNLRNAKSKLKEIEAELKDSEEELSQLKGNFLFVYDPNEIKSEAKNIYINSGLEQDIKRKNKLENELEQLKARMSAKWVEVEDEVTRITGRINKLYLTDGERLALCDEIDNYIAAKAWNLIEEGVNAHHTRGIKSNILMNSMEE